MTSTKTIVVLGATGNQGSSVVRAFLSQPGWRVRCVTRNISSDKAKALISQGAEVVQAELSDVESLVRAFEGAHAVFSLTDFWGPYMSLISGGLDKQTARQPAFDTEIQHAKNAAVAATRTPTLERFVYSALGPMSAASGGKFPHSLHWEAKAASVEWLEREQPELAQKTSYVYPGAYATNAFLYPQRNEETGEYVLLVPGTADMHFPVINELGDTMGLCVRALVEDEAPRTKLFVYDTDMTLGEGLDAWKKVTGKEARLESVTMEAMHERTRLPYEILDGAGFLNEYHFMTGVEGFIEPHHLKNKFETPSYEDFLRTRSSEQLLESRFLSFD
ncbi:NmrA-like family domain-containing protein [Paramyrothecium foliicola]|nr:NmrA-like family domain-containing protein [Paramyrothecium foliicola]